MPKPDGLQCHEMIIDYFIFTFEPWHFHLTRGKSEKVPDLRLPNSVMMRRLPQNRETREDN